MAYLGYNMSYDDLDTFNGDTEHDIWVDFDNYELRSNSGLHNYLNSPQNTGTPDELDLDEYIYNLNYWD